MKIEEKIPALKFNEGVSLYSVEQINGDTYITTKDKDVYQMYCFVDGAAVSNMHTDLKTLKALMVEAVEYEK